MADGLEDSPQLTPTIHLLIAVGAALLILGESLFRTGDLHWRDGRWGKKR